MVNNFQELIETLHNCVEFYYYSDRITKQTSSGLIICIN